MLRTRNLVAVALCIAAGSDHTARADDPVAILRATYPEVRVHNAGRNYNYFFGTQMTAGLTEAQAAAAFLAQHGGAFGGPLPAVGPGAGQPEVRELWTSSSRDGRFTAFAYRQKIRGKDVDGSDIRIKVRRGAVARVDFAAARVAAEPTSGSETPVLTAQVAAMVAQSLSGVPGLAVEGTPELVVLRGNTQRPDAWCWRVQCRVGEGLAARRPTYFVDTVLPRIVHVRANVHNWDQPTTGTVEGSGTSYAYPILPYQGPSTTLVTHRIPGIRVNGTVGTQSEHTFTNQDGEFDLDVGDPDQSILVSSTLEQAALWYQVYDPFHLAYISASELTEVGSNVPLVLSHSSMTEEQRVAQVDTVVSANRSRDFFLQYISTTLTGLSYPLYIRPNSLVPPPCNAAAGPLGSPPSAYLIAFAPAAANGYCWNLGTHSVVAHESGHVALYMLETAEGHDGFHEGYADAYANLVNDDTVQGRQQYASGASFREDTTSSGINCQYPLPTTGACDCDEPHLAGQLLSGPWVRIRNKVGLETARVLFGNWSLITLGGLDECGQSAHPGNLVEVLSISDPAGLDFVCAAFAAHNIVLSDGCP